MEHPVRAAALALLSLGCGLWPVACRPGLFGRGRARAELNARCYQCHVDFRGEELVESHERAGVGCVRCHGPSQAHMEDEVRRTLADATFRGKTMGVFCLTCHDPATYARTAAHAANDGLPPEKQKTCTGCHGDHVVVDTAAPTR